MRERSLRPIRGGASSQGRKVLSRGVFNAHERDVLSQIKKMLDLFKAQGLLSYRRIHVMPIKINRFQSRPNRDMAGMEDLQLYLFGGKVLFWELKSDKGSQSKEQKVREAELLALGCEYKIIRSLEQAISELRAKGLSLWSY